MKRPLSYFEGEALLRRMNRYELLYESQNKLDYVLALNVEYFLQRRLQTLVFEAGMAKSIHHARVLIRQRHIRDASDQCAIIYGEGGLPEAYRFLPHDPFWWWPPRRVKRKNQNAAAKKASGGDRDEDDEVNYLTR